MQALAVVEDLDLLEDGRSRGRDARQRLAADEFRLERREEALGGAGGAAKAIHSARTSSTYLPPFLRHKA